MADDQHPDQTTTSQIIDIKEQRIKKKAKEKEKKEPKFATPKSYLYAVIAAAIDKKLYSLIPDFPHKFYVLEPEPGVRLIVEEDDSGSVTQVTETRVVNAIMLYTAHLPDKLGPEYAWDEFTCRKCMLFWRGTTDPIESPVPVLWKDEPGFTYRRLPWNRKDSLTTKHPLFDEMFGRIKNAHALICWIGSLFDPDSNRQQYVWMFGEGGVGKSALIRFLQRVFGGAARSLEPPHPADSHWTAHLPGLRLAFFPDCNNTGFVRSSVFKQITGGDRVPINPKYQHPYDAELTVKVLISSNAKPRLSSETADTRRVIFCQMESPGEITEDDRCTYESRLWDEGSAFLASCIYEYEAHKGKLIRTDTSELDDLVMANEEPMAVFFAKYFKLDPNAHALPSDVIAALKLNDSWEFTRAEFYAWLERTHGIKGTKLRLGNDPCNPYKETRAYPGIKAVSPFSGI